MNRRIVNKPSKGEQLHSMYIQLLIRDESSAVHFVDNLSVEKKGCLSRYWKKIGNDKDRQVFFKNPVGA